MPWPQYVTKAEPSATIVNDEVRTGLYELYEDLANQAEQKEDRYAAGIWRQAADLARGYTPIAAGNSRSLKELAVESQAAKERLRNRKRQ